jgi:hypothetical protein
MALSARHFFADSDLGFWKRCKAVRGPIEELGGSPARRSNPTLQAAPLAVDIHFQELLAKAGDHPPFRTPSRSWTAPRLVGS